MHSDIRLCKSGVYLPIHRTKQEQEGDFLKLVAHNTARLRHLLTLYGMTAEALAQRASEGLTKPFAAEDLLADEIPLNLLKRIDAVFGKGLAYHLDPKAPVSSRETSIFFRKTQFGTDLNFGARQMVAQFEEQKHALAGLSKLAGIATTERRLPVYKLGHAPQEVAKLLRPSMYPGILADKKDFLKGLIARLAEHQILVFEFVETWNKKEKANIDGFFLSPNVIVLKRQQASFSREIFTLAHELGHYLLNEEEVEALPEQPLANQSATERWCNDFAYHFLAGDWDTQLMALPTASPANDYHHDFVRQVSEQTHLSQMALFTRLLYRQKISATHYKLIKDDFEEQFRQKLEAEKWQREQDKANGIASGGSTPQPIQSPLLVSTVQVAYHEGLISEREVCKMLRISPEKLDKYLA